MKRHRFLLTLVLVVGTAGCGAEASGTSQADSTETVQEAASPESDFQLRLSGHGYEEVEAWEITQVRRVADDISIFFRPVNDLKADDSFLLIKDIETGQTGGFDGRLAIERKYNTYRQDCDGSGNCSVSEGCEVTVLGFAEHAEGLFELEGTASCYDPPLAHMEKEELQILGDIAFHGEEVEVP
jgi:hypothetical protein